MEQSTLVTRPCCVLSCTPQHAVLQDKSSQNRALCLHLNASQMSTPIDDHRLVDAAQQASATVDTTSERSKPRPKRATPHTHPICHYGKDPNHVVACKYTWDEGPPHRPGTAAFYKSIVFRKKQAAGTIQVPGQRPGVTASAIGNHERNFHERSAKLTKPKSLVMIFGKGSVRRASASRSVHKRMQNYSRRT